MQNNLNFFNLDSSEHQDLVESVLKDPRDAQEDLESWVVHDQSIMFPQETPSSPDIFDRVENDLRVYQAFEQS